MASLHAIVFDFDGVIADSEPLHLRAFQATLAEEGITLSREDYFAKYLGYDDVGAFGAAGRDNGRPFAPAAIRDLVARKSRHMQALVHSGSVLFPGAADFIRSCANAVPIAIASGALRHEIEEILNGAGLRDLFPVIVASGDTPESKPSPAPYALAFDRLDALVGGGLDRTRTVAIEDSQWGLVSASGAGLRCVGVTNSYPAEALTHAEIVVGGLDVLTLGMLDELCDAARPV